MTTQVERPTGRSKIVVAIAALVISTLLLFFAARHARADLLAAYVEGYGGISNADMTDGTRGDPSAAVGAQLGARVLGLELYGDYTSLARGAAVERGILGLRLGFKLTDLMRLEIRGGGGVIAEQGGALSGAASADRAGLVARAGINLERRLMPTFLAGVGLNGEVFTLAPGESAVALQNTSWQQGMDVLATLHLKFELGI